MQFSVVIPCYNAEAWLESTLASVAAQSLAALEVIVVDDGSSDRSLALLQGQANVTRLLQTPNLGPAAARNAGIAAATGDWVAFLDADDAWKPDHLERIAALVGGTEDVVYLAAAEHYSINVNRVVSVSDNGPIEQPTAAMDHDRYFALYLQHGLLEMSSMAVRRDRLQAVGGFNSDFRGAEDLELMLRVVQGQTWAYDPVPSSIYRCNNPASYSRQERQRDGISLTAKFRTFLAHQDQYAIPEAMFRGYAPTLMSKAISQCTLEGRDRVQQLVSPYLAPSHKLLFAIAQRFPGLYCRLNNAKNQAKTRLKGQQYRPRKVVPVGTFR
jgi:glycosyltransferase involved in cell wall biosynthesis